MKLYMLFLVFLSHPFLLHTADQYPTEMPKEINSLIIKELQDSRFKDFNNAKDFETAIKSLNLYANTLMVTKDQTKNFLNENNILTIASLLKERFNLSTAFIIYALDNSAGEKTLKKNGWTPEGIFIAATHNNYFQIRPFGSVNEPMKPKNIFVTSQPFKKLVKGLDDSVIFNQKNARSWEENDAGMNISHSGGFGKRYKINQKTLEQLILFILLSDFVPPALTQENVCKYIDIYTLFYINKGYRDIPIVTATIERIVKIFSSDAAEQERLRNKVYDTFKAIDARYRDYLKASPSFKYFLSLYKNETGLIESYDNANYSGGYEGRENVIKMINDLYPISQCK